MNFIKQPEPWLVKWHEQLEDEQTLALRLLLGQGDPYFARFVFERTRTLQFGLKDVLYIGIDIRPIISGGSQEFDLGIALLYSRHIEDCLTGRSDTSGILETHTNRVRPLKCCGKESCAYTPERTLANEITSRLDHFGKDREIVLVVCGGEYNSLLLGNGMPYTKLHSSWIFRRRLNFHYKLKIPCDGLREAGIRAKFILKAMLGIAVRDMANHGIANATQAKMADAFQRIAKYQIPINRWDDPGYFLRSCEGEARRNWRRRIAKL
ncbi:hypothetical protein B0J14DRAFT_674350 [Halenospora varia]|nr:hypothetical protein B0J14DRAFT_674350 [Halenospora varia]